MKKTKYFTTKNLFQQHQYKECTDYVVEERDKFLTQNKDKIAKIDNENIIYTTVSNSYIHATIVLSYYEKE